MTANQHAVTNVNTASRDNRHVEIRRLVADVVQVPLQLLDLVLERQPIPVIDLCRQSGLAEPGPGCGRTAAAATSTSSGTYGRGPTMLISRSKAAAARRAQRPAQWRTVWSASWPL